MKYIFIGDVVGKIGEDLLNKFLAKRSKDYDIIIVNGENIDNGFGITKTIAKKLLNNNVDVITLGNHSFDKKEIYDYLKEENRILRPYNFSKSAPGNGYIIFEKKGIKIAVINLQGKVYMNSIHCPFLMIDELIEEIKEKANVIIVDFHAELTSEKQAMGWNLAGKVSVIYGTHTHVQTADEKILNNKTAYITDIGMTGGHNGVIGMNKREVIKKFKDGMPTKYVVCDENPILNAIEVEIDNKGFSKSINRIKLSYEEI